jgi:hypothetical protein
LRTRFEQEAAALRQQLAEDIGKMHKEQAKSGKGAALLSQISDFRLEHGVVDDEARKRNYCVEEQNIQQDRALCLLQKEVSDLQATYLRLAGDNGQLVDENKEVADLREAHVREIASMTA